MTTNEDLLQVLDKLRLQADRNSADMKREVMKRMDELEDKVEEVKMKAIEKEKKEEQVIEGMQKRLESIEKKLVNLKDKSERDDKAAEEQRRRTNKFKEQVGIKVVEDIPEQKAKTWSELVRENKEEEEQKRIKENERKVKHWSKKVKITEKKKEIDTEKEKEEADIAAIVEDEKMKENLKMGDSSQLHGESDWSWDEGEGEWEGTEDRLEREKRKRIHRYRKRKVLKEKTARKGKHMIGLGPICRQSIGFFNDVTADYEYAKVLAVNEYLMEYLQISEEDMKDFTVVDTMIAKREEDLIYVTFKEYEAIREIHRRTAELKNEEIMVQNYIPPQFWERFSHLNRYCMDLKNDDKDVKFQIRFNDKDLEVLIKNRRTDEHYYILPLEDIEKKGEIPKFNYSITWTKRTTNPTGNLSSL